MRRLLEVLTRELGATRCLEIGVGTGRFALPLARSGTRITGIDISREMLRRLVDNSGGETIPLALADATRLPFDDATFDAGMAVHVLHLIPNWREAVAELVRVIRPGGRVIADSRGPAHAEWWYAVRHHFFGLLGDPRWPPGLGHIEELDEEMRVRGAGVRMLPIAIEERTLSIREAIGMCEAGVYSACWSFDDASRASAAESTRQWAASSVGDLDEPRTVSEEMVWRAYDLP